MRRRPDSERSSSSSVSPSSRISGGNESSGQFQFEFGNSGPFVNTTSEAFQGMHLVLVRLDERRVSSAVRKDEMSRGR
jgi:hypothetical protein